jgi:Domain of unknown function (DUF1905)
MPKIRFQAKLTAIGSQAILRLPQAASSKLPSRGMSMVEGTFNGRAFQAPLEPDGIGSHCTRAIRIEKTLSKLRSGKRAACCFNRSQCTDPSMSRKGVLLEPTPAMGESEGRQARSRRT